MCNISYLAKICNFIAVFLNNLLQHDRYENKGSCNHRGVNLTIFAILYNIYLTQRGVSLVLLFNLCY